MNKNINIPHDQWHRGWWLQGSDKIQYNHDGQAIYLNYTWPDCSPSSGEVLFLVDHKQRVTHCRKTYPIEYRPLGIHGTHDAPYSVTMIAEAPKTTDMVNHPPHYNQPGQPEVWEQMVSLFGKEAYINFARLSAFKYRMRAGYKQDAAEDIKKAMWYEKKIQELTNNQ